MTDLGLEWTKGPELLIAREGHRSISIENQVYHFGGYGNLYEFLTFTLKIIRNHLGKRKGGRSRKIQLRRSCSIWNLVITMSFQKFLQ